MCTCVMHGKAQDDRKKVHFKFKKITVCFWFVCMFLSSQLQFTNTHTHTHTHNICFSVVVFYILLLVNVVFFNFDFKLIFKIFYNILLRLHQNSLISSLTIFWQVQQNGHVHCWQFSTTFQWSSLLEFDLCENAHSEVISICLHPKLNTFYWCEHGGSTYSIYSKSLPDSELFVYSH